MSSLYYMYRRISSNIRKLMKAIFFIAFISVFILGVRSNMVIISGIVFLLTYFYSSRKIGDIKLIYKLILLTLQMISLTLYLYLNASNYSAIVFMTYVFELLMVFPGWLGISYSIAGYIIYLRLWDGWNISFVDYIFQVFNFSIFVFAISNAKTLQIKNVTITKLNEQIAQQNHEIQEVTKKNERQVIAEEMHDTIGHTLTAAIVLLDSAELLLDKNPKQASLMLTRSRKLLKDSLSDVRQVVKNLKNTPMYGEQNLKSKLTSLIQSVSQSGLLSITFEIQLNESLSSLHDYVIFYTIQEALTNILRHAKASKASVEIYIESLSISILIKDDGVGSESIDFGFGLNTMRQRVCALGGELTVSSAPNCGYTLRIRLPIMQEAEVDRG